MKHNQVRQVLFPILAAFIWGTAFVAQDKCADVIDPFTFNAIRCYVAVVALLVIIVIFDKVQKNKPVLSPAEKKAANRQLWIGGLCKHTAHTSTSRSPGASRNSPSMQRRYSATTDSTTAIHTGSLTLRLKNRLAQKGSNPTVVTILLSLESVFAVVSGALISHESMTGREYLGCVLMFAAVILAQLDLGKKEEQPTTT